MILIKGDHLKKIILLSAFIVTIAFGLCGCKKDDATVHFASETEQTAVVSSDVNRQTADSKEKKASSAGDQEQNEKDTAAASDDSTEWCVYICGQVANPGVYRVKPGARVCELVDMAGGMLETADKSFWNLASELYDGQMLYFPTAEELESDHIPEGSYATGMDGSLMKGGVEEHIGVKDGKLNINTATAEQLMALSGIGESKAKSIVEDRAKNGLFSSIEDITRVSGIGEAMFNKIKDDITVK